MHKLLIVDDDQIIRAGMKQSINWEKNGIEVIGTAGNGQECLEMIPNCLPDIILTDIKMPFMDGIQLTEAVYRLYPQIKVVLLTAYDDFKYAKMALNYKVCQYVMKYEHNSEVLKAVLKAAREYDDQKDNVEIVKRSLALLINKFFNDLVVNYENEERMAERSAQLKIRFLSRRFCVVCVDVGHSAVGDGEILLWQRKQLCGKAGAILQKRLTCDETLVYYFTGDIHLNLVVNFFTGSDREQEDFFSRLKRSVAMVGEELDTRVQAGVGTLCEGYENIIKSYTEAVQALELKNMVKSASEEEKTVIRFEEVKNGSVSHMALLRQILAFIDANYHQETLSLNRIAEEVHLTPSYISTLFKKYQGVNISDYLIDIRIKKAMELLAGTDYKTYEISERVGYSNPQYFSVVFKRITGFAPIEYRRVCRD